MRRSSSSSSSYGHHQSDELTLMGSSHSQSQIKHHPYSSDSHKMQTFDDYRHHNKHDDHDHHRYYYDNDHAPLNLEREEQPKKVMHHFLDEWAPKDKDSWRTNSEDKMPTHRTQLSISIPNSMHDFFVTQKW